MFKFEDIWILELCCLQCYCLFVFLLDKCIRYLCIRRLLVQRYLNNWFITSVQMLPIESPYFDLNFSSLGCFYFKIHISQEGIKEGKAGVRKQISLAWQFAPYSDQALEDYISLCVFFLLLYFIPHICFISILLHI